IDVECQARQAQIPGELRGVVGAQQADADLARAQGSPAVARPGAQRLARRVPGGGGAIAEELRAQQPPGLLVAPLRHERLNDGAGRVTSKIPGIGRHRFRVLVAALRWWFSPARSIKDSAEGDLPG